jgi:hypothetical protein
LSLLISHAARTSRRSCPSLIFATSPIKLGATPEDSNL